MSDRIQLDLLHPHEENPREISDQALEGLKASIVESTKRRADWTGEGYRLATTVTVNTQGQRIVGGHQRIRALQALGQDWIHRDDVSWVSIEPDSPAERALIVNLNNSHIGGHWSAGSLPFMEGIKTDAPELFGDLGLGELLDDLKRSRPWKKHEQVIEGATDPDSLPASPIEAVTAPGDVWLLGAHRVRCGDSTGADDVESLFAGASPFMMVTDPPYGVEYDPSWRVPVGLNTEEGGRMGEVENDDRADWSEAWSLFPGAVAYVWHASLRTPEVQASLEACGFEPRAMIIWNKGRGIIGRSHYHWGHEPCLYMAKPGQPGGSKWCGSRTESTVWDINPVHQSEDDNDVSTNHGTQKPVECMRKPIMNHGEAQDSVYDPFLGSGTTLIAAEQAGRTFFGMELNPIYVDIAVTRWQEFTGSEATLEATGETFNSKRGIEVTE